MPVQHSCACQKPLSLAKSMEEVVENSNSVGTGTSLLSRGVLWGARDKQAPLRKPMQSKEHDTT
eukprot:1990634-Pyramimonas_sp.AAC.3